jgi:hypothetical protein
MNPDLPCLHEDFMATVEVVRRTEIEDGPVVGYMAEVHVRCAVCDEPFRWIGVPAGMKATQPMCSADETELRAPVRPASADPDFGMGIPGFAIAVHSGMERVEDRDYGPASYDEDDHGVIPDWRFPN